MSDLTIFEEDMLRYEINQTIEQVKNDLMNNIESLNYDDEIKTLKLMKKEFIKEINRKIEIEKSRSDE